jgi:6-phosphofructo-2-kinase
MQRHAHSCSLRLALVLIDACKYSWHTIVLALNYTTCTMCFTLTQRDGKLIVAMTGLPARGKTFLAHALLRHFNWIGLRSRIFSVVEYRREHVGLQQPNDFFSADGAGEAVRLRIATLALDDALAALCGSDTDIAIYDAANITVRRRQWVVDRVKACAGLHAQVVFVECLCYDQTIIDENIR